MLKGILAGKREREKSLYENDPTVPGCMDVMGLLSSRSVELLQHLLYLGVLLLNGLQGPLDFLEAYIFIFYVCGAGFILL